MTGLHETLLRRPRLIALAALLLAGLSVLPLLSTSVDNSLEVWLLHGSPEYRDYRKFVDAFGSEEFILVTVEGDDVLAPRGLAALRAATRRAAAVPGITSALSPTTVLDALDIPDDQGRRVLLAVPTYRRLLVSVSGRVAAIYLTVDPSVAARPVITAQTRRAVAPLADEGFHLRLGGPPVLNAELNTLSSSDPPRLFPVVFLVTVILLGFLFRTVAGVLVPLATLLVTVLVSVAAVDLAGRQLNLITVGFPTVLWVLGLSQSIHLITSYGRRRAAGLRGREAVLAAVRNVRYPCFLMAVTTSAGFLSLLLSNVGPVRELGAYTAGGILIGFAVNLVLGPALLLWRGPEADGLAVKVRGEGMSRLPAMLRWVGRFRSAIVAVALALMVASVVASREIEVETNALRFLRSGNALLEDYHFIQRELVGLSSLEIDLVRAPGESFATTLTKVDAFAREVTRRYPDSRVMSVDDFLKAAAFHASTASARLKQLDDAAIKARVTRAFHETRPFARALLLPLVRPQLDLSPFVTADNSRLRITAFSPRFEGKAFARFDRRVTALAHEHFGEQATITGISGLLVAMQSYLVESQIKCLGAALVIIFLFTLLAARNLRLALLCMLPNVFPVVLNFGLMGLLGTRLDAATMMIASVAMGIAVDNTIHVLVAFRSLRAEGLSTIAALEGALVWKGRAIVYTTVVTSLGFSVLVVSRFLPMGWFGGLTAFTIVMAVIGVLFLMPALLWRREAAA